MNEIQSMLRACLMAQERGRPYALATVVTVIQFPYSGVEVEALIEPVKPPVALVLFGAGQDAIPIAAMARLLNWNVTVVDEQASLLTPDRFPGAVVMLDELANGSLALDDRTAAIIMSHSYSKDLEWLRRILPSNIGYIGLLGPRKRAEQMHNELRDEGIVLRNADQRRLHSPTGLDLGSETAEGIALSVVAEIQAVMHDRSGGFLRERALGIHEPITVEHSVDYTGASQKSCLTLV
jgi:xanthine/CO dehydrogenase XdhC/CoxF family maturation factor